MHTTSADYKKEIALWKSICHELKSELENARAQISDLKHQFKAALNKISVLQAEKEEANARIAALEAEILTLKEQIFLMRHQQFGRKSEADETGEPENNALQSVAGYSRKKGKKTRGRLIDTRTLLRHKIIHDLKENEKICTDCHQFLHQVGYETSEQIEVIPLKLYVAEHIRYKYACSHCRTLIMAPKPEAPLPKALAGGSLLTEVIVGKYAHHLPLYRQSKIFAHYNANIPDSTLGQWVMQCAAALEPLYKALWKAVLSAAYLQVDETPVKVLTEKKRGYLWAYFAPHLGKGLIAFDFNLTRSGKVAEARLATFKGLLQTDGYSGYQNLRQRKDIAGFGCLTHGRRKFDAVLKISKNKKGIAAEMIEQLKPLYALEERMRQRQDSFHTRKRLRGKQAWPLLKSLKTWLKQKLKETPPKSKLAVSIHYMLKQWPYIIKYLRHGSVEIDTNWVENQIRLVALGRRNWLFVGNEDSGSANAFWFSIVGSAIMNGLNPVIYIHFLLTKIHDIRRGSIDPETLLPHVIDRSLLKSFEDEQLALARQILDSS